MNSLVQAKDCPPIPINIFHIIVVAPLFAYLGYMGVQNQPIGKLLAYILIALAVVVALYHSYRVWEKNKLS